VNCNCLCAVNHRYAKGICTGEHDRTIQFSGPTGKTPVSMCTPCADETLAHNQLEKMGKKNGKRILK
jgi:hypothetical protein